MSKSKRTPKPKPADQEAAILARKRYYLIMFANLLFVAGAVVGVIIIGRANLLWIRLIGAGIVIMGLYCMAVIPRAMAHRWRTQTEK